MTTHFPSELPDRPQKLGFTKRLTQKLALKTAKQKKPVAISDPFTPGSVLPTASGHSAFSASDLSSTNVLARQQTAPASFDFGAGRNRRASSSENQIAQVRPPASSFFPHRPPAPINSNHPLQALYPTHSFERPRPTPLPGHIRRKHLPPSPFGGLLQDPLVQRFKQLRIPQNNTTRERALPSAVPLAPPPSPSTHNINSATSSFTHMNLSNTTSPTRRRQSQPLPRRRTAPSLQGERMLGSLANRPIVIDDEVGSRKAATELERSGRSFSPTNYFQSPNRGRSHQRYRSAPSNTQSQRRSRSPRGSSNSSRSTEHASTPGSSDVSYPDLSSLVALADESGGEAIHPTIRGLIADAQSLAAQEEQDRQLAQWLQQEEDGIHVQPQHLFQGDIEQASQEIHVAPLANPKNSQLTNPKQAPKPQGSRENPIDLDLDSFDWANAFWGNQGDRMEIDENSPALHKTSPIEELDEFAQRDVEASKKIQPKEYIVQNGPSGTRDCAVCGENSLIMDLPSLADCTHRPETCADCFSAWIGTQLRDSSWSEVKCPGDGCKIQLAYFEIQQYATPEVFQQYDTFIARAAFSEDPNFRWCRNCNSGQIHMTGVEGPIFTCINCQRKVCVIHENTWHEGETCEEYEYRASGQKERDQKAQEKASLKAIGKLSKKCPGPNCHYSIEKNDGCDHMTCSRCRYQFCWICLCDYNAVRREGNSAHTTACKYHSERLR